MSTPASELNAKLVHAIEKYLHFVDKFDTNRRHGIPTDGVHVQILRKRDLLDSLLKRLADNNE